MSPIFLEVAEQGIMVLAGLAFTALGAIGTYYINKLVGHLRDEEALEMVGRYVRWAEQAPAYQDFDGAEKFELVFTKAVMWLTKQGIDVDPEELEAMIEAAVQQLKTAAEPLYLGE